MVTYSCFPEPRVALIRPQTRFVAKTQQLGLTHIGTDRIYRDWWLNRPPGLLGISVMMRPMGNINRSCLFTPNKQMIDILER